MPSAPSLVRIGRHALHYEETLLLVRWVGIPTLAEQHEIYELIRKYQHAQGKTLLLFDLSEAGPIDADHRRASAEWWRKAPLHSIALAQFGMTPAVRLLVTLIGRAVGILSGVKPRIENFATESEARAWLDQMRGELRTIET